MNVNLLTIKITIWITKVVVNELLLKTSFIHILFNIVYCLFHRLHGFSARTHYFLQKIIKVAQTSMINEMLKLKEWRNELLEKLWLYFYRLCTNIETTNRLLENVDLVVKCSTSNHRFSFVIRPMLIRVKVWARVRARVWAGVKARVRAGVGARVRLRVSSISD